MKQILNLCTATGIYHINKTTVDPVYSERVGAAKSVHYNRVFTINVFNFIIN
jgi:hypothetical protein